MHLRAALLWVSGIVASACGPSSNAPSGDSGDGGSTAAGTTAASEPLDYEACNEPLSPSTDAFESPDTARFAELLQQAIIDAGYGEAARVEGTQMIDSNAVRFCAKVSVRSHWFAATDYACFEHGGDDEMRAQFAAYLAEWSALPATMISLEEVETIANGCFAGIYHPYEPCKSRPWDPYTFQLSFTANRWIDACTLETDVATIDLATGALLTCETYYGGGGCEEEG